MPNSDLSTSLVRTIVPIITGLILSGLLKVGIEVEPGVISVAVDAVVTGGWYAIIRTLEQKFPNVGLLLGSRATPHYSEPLSSWSSKKPPG